MSGDSVNELETLVPQTPGAIDIIGQPPAIASRTTIVDGKNLFK
ncbi:MAG: hypothetical protein WKG06_24790 [Segetibacter sp.]